LGGRREGRVGWGKGRKGGVGCGGRWSWAGGREGEFCEGELGWGGRSSWTGVERGSWAGGGRVGQGVRGREGGGGGGGGGEGGKVSFFPKPMNLSPQNLLMKN
jgi:hypothetical protein